MDTITLGLRLKYDGKDVEGGLVISRDHLRQFTVDARKAGEAVSGSMTSAARGVRSISEQLEQLRAGVLGYLSVTQAANATGWILAQASAMQQLEARIKVATATEAEYARAKAAVFEVSNRWGAAVDQTAGAFARLNPVVAQMGGGAEITIRMLDGLAASLRLSGATTAETSAILLQFSQAMGSGRVGGDEFKSMMESAEPLMRAVAGEMGKTTAELREMAEAGRLTSSVFGNALLPAIDKLKDQAAQIPLGIGQAWQVLHNNLSRDFGREFADQSSAVGGAIQGLSEHTVELAAAVHAAEDGLLALSKAGAVVAAGAGAAWMTKQGQAAWDSVAAWNAARVAQAAAKAETIAALEADIAKARTTMALVEADHARAAADRAAATATIYATQAIGVQSAALAANMEAKAAYKGATLLLMETERTAATLKRELAVAEEALTKARNAGAGAAGLARTAMAALGGPIGLVTTALTAGAAAWAIWGESADDSAQKGESAIDRVRSKLAAAQKQNRFGTGDLGQARQDLQALQEEQKRVAQLFAEMPTVYRTAKVNADNAVREAETLVATLEKQQGAAGRSVTDRLSSANEYSKLTADLQWREKVMRKGEEDLLNLQQAYADKWMATEAKNRAALEREHVAALEAQLAQNRKALEALDKDRVGAGNRAGVEALEQQKRLIDEGTRAEAAALESRLKQGEIGWRQYYDQLKAMRLAANQAAIDVTGRELDLAVRRGDGAATEKYAGELRRLGQERVAIEAEVGDAIAEKERALRLELQKFDVDTWKATGKLQMAAATEFWAKYGALWKDAVDSGNDGLAAGFAQAYVEATNNAGFQEAKVQFEAALADLKARLDEIRQQAEADGGLEAALDAAGASEAIKRQLMPEIERLLQRMKQMAGENPLNGKVVTEAAANMRKLGDDIDPVWKDTIKNVDRTFHDGFVRMLETGKGSWKSFSESLRNTFKSTVADAIYQMFARPFVFQAVGMAANAVGLNGLAGAANGVSSAGGIINAGSSAYNLYTGATTSTIASGISWLGNATGWSAASEFAAGMSGASLAPGLAGPTTAGATGAMGAGYGFAQAIPYIGLAIAAISLISSLLGDGGGPKVEGGWSYGFGEDGSLADLGTGELYSDGRRNNRKHSANAAMASTLKPVATNTRNFVESLGGNMDGMSVAMQFNSDPAGDAPDMVASSIRDKDGKILFQHANNDLERGSYQQEMQTETKRLMIGAVDAADIDPIFEAIVHGVDLATASVEQLDQTLLMLSQTGQILEDVKAAGLDELLLKVATQVKETLPDMLQVISYAVADPIEEGRKAAETASRSLFGTWQVQGDSLRELMASYDGSANSARALATAAQQRYQTELQLVQQIRQEMASTSAMFSDSSRTIQMSVLDDRGKYNFLDAEADSYRSMISTLTDDKLIAQYAEKLNANIMQGWNLLSPEEQKRREKEYLALIESDNELVQSRLQATEDSIATEHQDLQEELARLGDAIDLLTAAADTQQTAADTQQAAANTQLQAAQTPLAVTVNGQTAAEVGGW